MGLFGDPAANELSHLIVGTDLASAQISSDKEYHFNFDTKQLFLPYGGASAQTGKNVNRVGISWVQAETIISKGAIETPQRLVRIRPEPKTDRLLGFSSDAIELFEPAADTWQMTPILEYFTPIAVYRYTDEDDYVEVLRLGNQCKLHFSKMSALNQRGFHCAEVMGAN